MVKTVLRLFVVYPPGLEELGLSEISSLGYSGRPLPGGVELKGGLEVLYRLNWACRLANRVLVRVADFRAKGLEEFEEKVSRYPWEIYLPRGEGLRVRVTSKRSHLYHQGAIVERAIRGVAQRLKREIHLCPPEEGQGLVVRIEKDRCLLSIDSSGVMLFRRGWRRALGPAPLRENLASALLALADWRGDRALVDPFCGSGTIAIEAALLARGRPPGERRSFAFERWRNFDPLLWDRVKRALAPEVLGGIPPILAADISRMALDAARENAASAEVLEDIRFIQADFSTLRPPASTGEVVTNPPYGKRLLSGRSLTALYRRLGLWLQERFSGWGLTIVCPRAGLVGQLGFPLKRVATFPHGGQRVGVFRGQIP
ncbi:THUMP domain-containing class I SAM-dependent RNA methyltransferase [Thermosulfuriphilus sp.]